MSTEPKDERRGPPSKRLLSQEELAARIKKLRDSLRAEPEEPKPA